MINIDYIYARDDCFVVFEVGYVAGYPVYSNDKRYAEIAAYLAEHPEALQDEPIPPPPTDTELGARAEATRQALFAEYDVKALQYQRKVRLGVAGGAERLAAWDAYAEALRAVNDTEGWYKDPQWPQKPEV